MATVQITILGTAETQRTAAAAEVLVAGAQQVWPTAVLLCLAQAVALAGTLAGKAESGAHMIGTNLAVQRLVPQEQVESLVAEMVAVVETMVQLTEATVESLAAEEEAEEPIVLVALVGKAHAAKSGFGRIR